MWSSRAVAIGMGMVLCGGAAAQQVTAQQVTAQQVTAQQVTAQQVTARDTGERVGGKVVSDVDGRAMANVVLNLTDTKTQDVVASATSDEEGHFQFEPVAAGKYSLGGVASHYLVSHYLQHDFYWTAIVTGAGLATGDLELRMMPAATISGKVAGDDGEPVTRAMVQLYREDTTSSKRVTQIQNVACNDQGDYEFTGLARGRYYLSAIGSPWYAVHPPMEAEGTQVPYRASVDPGLDVVYAMEFYPDATNSDDASALIIGGGEQLTANMAMHVQHSVSLTLRLPAGETVNQHQGMLARMVFGSLEQINTQTEFVDGVERINGIAPGQYTLEEIANGNVGQMRTEPVDLSNAAASMELPKLGQLATVVVSLHVAEGETLPVNLQASLRAPDGRFVYAREIDDKGVITFGTVAPGDYVFQVYGGGRQLGVLAVSVGGKQVMDGRLHVGNGGSEPVDVRVSTVEVEVDGFVRRGGKAGVASMVVLVPAGKDSSEELFRRDQSDLDGSFVFHNVLPGNYIVVAIDDGWPLRWTDVTALAPYLAHGLPVTIGSRSRPVEQLAQPILAQPR